MNRIQLGQFSPVTAYSRFQGKEGRRSSVTQPQGSDTVRFGNSDEIEVVRLKNGSEEPKPFVVVTMMKLDNLTNSGFLGVFAFHELVMKCRDRNYRFFRQSEQTLKNFGFVQEDGNIEDSVRNVVLSAVEDDAVDMRLGSPVEKSDPS